MIEVVDIWLLVAGVLVGVACLTTLGRKARRRARSQEQLRAEQDRLRNDGT